MNFERDDANSAHVSAKQAIDEEWIWSQLPAELLVKSSFLSVPTLFRCRAVCKTWNTRISSPELASLCSRAHVQKSHVVLVGLPGLSSLWLTYMFDARANKWYHPIDLTFLQPYWEVVFGEDATKGLIRRRVLAACGSVICVAASSVKGDEVLVACNPVCKTFRELPLVKSWAPFGAYGLVHIIPDTRIFYLEFLFEEKLSSRLHLYDSSLNEWRLLNSVAKGLHHEQSVDRCSMVHYKNVLYVLWYEDSPIAISYLQHGKYVLMAYQLLQDEWTEVECDLSLSLRRVKLVVSGPWLLLVGTLEDTYHIWKLEVSSGVETHEIARMPDFFTRRMLDDPFNALICGYGEAVFFMSAKGKPVLYDLASGTWQRLPSLTNTSQGTLPHFHRSKLFENFVDFCLDVPLSY